MRFATVRRALVATAALCLLTIPVVSAESIAADSDILKADIQGSIDLGTVAPSTEVPLSLWFVLTCTGTSHVDATQAIRLNLGAKTIPDDGQIHVGGLTFGLGSDWPADGQPCPDGIQPTIGGPLHFSVTSPSHEGHWVFVFRWNASVVPTGNDDANVFGGGSVATMSISMDVGGSTPPANTPPTLRLPANMTVEGNTTGGATVSYTATATDAEDATAPAVSCDKASGSFFALGVTTVSCSATDSGGLTTTGSFSIVVQDTTAPSLHLPADLTIEGNTSGGAHVSFVATASDVVDNAPSVSCSPASGSLFALGATTVHCTATDASGQTASGSFSVTVVDTTAPVLSGMPGDVTLTTSNPGGATLTYAAPTATDVVDASPNVSCNPASGATIPVGDTTVTCTAADASGNSSSATFAAHVRLAAATWVDPAAGGLVVNGSRTVPIKVGLSLDGIPITTGTAIVSVVPCGGGDAVQTDPLALQSNGRWIGHLSTDGLASGCYLVVASANGVAIGSFRMDVRPDSSTASKPATAPKSGPKK